MLSLLPNGNILSLLTIDLINVSDIFTLFAKALIIVVEKVASLFMLAELSCKVSRIAGAVPMSDDMLNSLLPSYMHHDTSPFTSDDKLIPVPGMMFLIVDPHKIN